MAAISSSLRTCSLELCGKTVIMFMLHYIAHVFSNYSGSIEVKCYYHSICIFHIIVWGLGFGLILKNLRDLRGKEIEGKFYAEEIQKINVPGNAVRKRITTKGIGASIYGVLRSETRRNKDWISRDEYIKTQLI